MQGLLDPETAGVMFTRNPVTGSDERVIEASWGLGESVVAGRVIPDHFRLGLAGQVLERIPGRKSMVFRSLPAGGTARSPNRHGRVRWNRSAKGGVRGEDTSRVRER